MPYPWWSLPFVLPLVAVAHLRQRHRDRRMWPILGRMYYYVGQKASVKTDAHRQRYFSVLNGQAVTVARWWPVGRNGHYVEVVTGEGRRLVFPGGHIIVDEQDAE